MVNDRKNLTRDFPYSSLLAGRSSNLAEVGGYGCQAGQLIWAGSAVSVLSSVFSLGGSSHTVGPAERHGGYS
jgi:hypothetical protein